MNEHINDVTSEAPSPTPPEMESSEIRGSESCEVQAPRPPEEQRRYWERDLFYKRLGLIISGGGFILIIVGFGVNITQSNRVEKSIRANVQNSVLNHVLTLDKLFMEKPYLIPYFYEGKPIDEKDEKYQEVAATAEMILDIFDLISVQNKSYLEFWDSPQAWDEWITDTFSTSPILRDTLDKRSNWYDKILLELRQKGQKRLEEKAAKEAKSQGS
ncbi:MAG: hypothetical protein LC785_12610 [Acidobacteria bacterium]|nr:hypothetical protein [Acidobacteriota bacterium]